MSMLQNFTQTVAGKVARVVINPLSRKRLPQVEGKILINGLDGPAEILRDRWGVPHIYADTTADLFFSQGFVHAQDRLWQMEINRRIALGRLSEIFGEAALETDRTVRTFGFNRLGINDWAEMSADLKKVLLSYVAGINAYIKHNATRKPIEFTLIRHRPSLWRPEDCTAFSRLMMWKMSHAWYSELIRAQVIEAVGENHAAELEIHYPMENPVTLPEGIEFNRLNSDGTLMKSNGPFLERGVGSNAWVVNGKRSTSGKPLLCNDIHLPISQPGVWYVNHLVADRFKVAGASIPGLPLVLAGHNNRIAWGITLAFTDAEDLFVEKMDDKLPNAYRFKGKWRDAEVIPERIIVKGRDEAHIENIVLTHHGPIISRGVGVSNQHVALCSMALKPGRSFEGWRLLNLADGWDDFVSAMSLIDNTQLNISYADGAGNIGHWVTGKVPIRNQGNGSVPAPGWSGKYDWLGEVPFEEMPHALNPKAGFIVSCNHRLMPDDYPHFLGNAWMNGYRARRIEQLLGSQKRLSPEACRTMQMDVTCLPGIALKSHLKQIHSKDPKIQIAIKWMTDWDGRLTADSVGGAIYEVTRSYLVRNLLEPGLGSDLTESMMGRGFHPLLLSSHEFYGYDTVTLLRLLDTHNSWWVRRAGGRRALLKKSLKQAVDWLQTTLWPNDSVWHWGKIHQVTLAHPLGQRKPLNRVLNRGPFPVGGDTDTPCQTAHAPDSGYDDIFWAPSYRQIIDLSDWSRSVFALPGGQSGHLGSPHYDDLTSPWLEGDYQPMLWNRTQVENQTKHRLELVPDGGGHETIATGDRDFS